MIKLKRTFIVKNVATFVLLLVTHAKDVKPNFSETS